MLFSSSSVSSSCCCDLADYQPICGPAFAAVRRISKRPGGFVSFAVALPAVQALRLLPANGSFRNFDCVGDSTNADSIRSLLASITLVTAVCFYVHEHYIAILRNPDGSEFCIAPWKAKCTLELAPRTMNMAHYSTARIPRPVLWHY